MRAPLRNLASNGLCVKPLEVPDAFRNSRVSRVDISRSSTYLVTGSRWIISGAVMSISSPGLLKQNAQDLI